MLNLKAFSIFELLIAILITSILAAVAIPLYKTNIDKVKVAEAMVLLNRDLKGLSEQIIYHGLPTNITETQAYKDAIGGLSVCGAEAIDPAACPVCNSGIADPTGCNFDSWGVTLKFSSVVANPTFHVHFYPQVINGNVYWHCGNGGGSSNNASEVAERTRLLGDKCPALIGTVLTNAGVSSYPMW